jgi:hypothetical protein
MRVPRYRIRTLMIAVAMMAIIGALLVVYFQGHHIHDFYVTVGSDR